MISKSHTVKVYVQIFANRYEWNKKGRSRPCITFFYIPPRIRSVHLSIRFVHHLTWVLSSWLVKSRYTSE